jgi:selenocysteine lyase/cysteine desulfurase
MLREIGMTVYDQGDRRCGIVTSAVGSIASPDLRTQLAKHGINSTATHVGSSRYDVERRDLPSMLRLSVHYITTADELDRTIATLRNLI